MNLSISKEQTRIIKGIAIGFCVLGHLNIIKNSGAWGVGLFLIISGYGLTKSFYKNGLSKFFEKKIFSVLIPYQLVTIILLIIDKINGENYKFSQVIISLSGFDFKAVINATMWYIPYIFIWYIVFFMIFKYIKRINNRIIFLVLFSLLLAIVCISGLWNKATGSFLYVFQFPIGVILALFDEKKIIMKNYNVKEITFYTLGISLLLLIVTYGRISNPLVYLININSVCSIILSLIFLISNFKSKILSSIGGISYELYLIESIFLTKYDFIFKYITNRFMAIVSYILIIYLISILLKETNILLIRLLKKLIFIFKKEDFLLV